MITIKENNQFLLIIAVRIMNNLSAICTLRETVVPNSLVSAGSNVLLAGNLAMVKKQGYPFWWERDGEVYMQRVKTCESLKHKMGLHI